MLSKAGRLICVLHPAPHHKLLEHFHATQEAKTQQTVHPRWLGVLRLNQVWTVSFHFLTHCPETVKNLDVQIDQKHHTVGIVT